MSDRDVLEELNNLRAQRDDAVRGAACLRLENEALRADIARLRRVEDVSRKILARWRAQEARAAEWQRLAARAYAADPDDRDEQRAIRRERNRLDAARLADFGGLRMELGVALGE